MKLSNVSYAESEFLKAKEKNETYMLNRLLVKK